MKFYAQLNENNICIGISQLSGEVIQKNLIEITSNDSDYLWKKYENGNWSAGKFEPVPEPVTPEPTNTEIMDNQMVLMDVIATMYEDMLAKGMV